MAARIGAGNVGQAATKRARSGSSCANPCANRGGVSPKSLVPRWLEPVSIRLLTGLFQVRVLVGELDSGGIHRSQL
jgi:hypothetical protein